VLAGTVVVRERVPVRGGPVAQMPPQLAGWAASLPLSALPDDLALATRQFLSRRHELNPGVREDMGARLAADVARYVGQGVPLGVPAWAYLSAVLAERRRRELARLGPPQNAPPPQPPQPFRPPAQSPAIGPPTPSSPPTPPGPFAPPG